MASEGVGDTPPKRTFALTLTLTLSLPETLPSFKCTSPFFPLKHTLDIIFKPLAFYQFFLLVFFNTLLAGQEFPPSFPISRRTALLWKSIDLDLRSTRSSSPAPRPHQRSLRDTTPTPMSLKCVTCFSHSKECEHFKKFRALMF